MTSNVVDWIGFTTRYREGGAMIERAAHTLAQERRDAGANVIVQAVESKRDFVDAMSSLSNQHLSIQQLHFVGHAGMYGPMFRTSQMPEQFSPHEWKVLSEKTSLPFASNGEAFFHSCRTARWFAPFFARTFGVPTYGYHWYTSFSAEKDRFRWVRPGDKKTNVYMLGCPGRKSHGLLASVEKYSGRIAVEKMRRYEPSPIEGDASYDEVAKLYDQVFEDIRVRQDEWHWIARHITDHGTTAPRVLDIGCGNGALLQQLENRIESGLGVDSSAAMLKYARHRNTDSQRLRFEQIDGPKLPAQDHSIDIVVSMLSFRYLDWDPLMQEIIRVLAPGGRLLVVDMVTAPLRRKDLPAFALGKLRGLQQRTRNARYRKALGNLVTDSRWRTMLRYNPIRSEHEFRWYLESRFPGRLVETLNIGFNNRVLAFDSGPIPLGTWVAPQSYP